MATAQAAQRANQRSAKSLGAGFNGVLTILALALQDEPDLKFTANVTYQTGDAGQPSATFTPCDDFGRVKKFSDVDDIIKWLNGAFFDITSIVVTVDDATVINKPFNPPTDAVKDATAQKARFVKYLAAIDDKVDTLTAKVASEVLAGWSAPTAHPVLQANHAETNKQLSTAQEIADFYGDEITRFTAIITAGV